MKSWIFLCAMSFFVFGGATASYSQSIGGNGMYWDKIKEAESRIKKIEATWQSHMVSYGEPSLDMDKYIAQLEAQSSVRPRSPEQKKIDLQNARSFAKSIKEGSVQSSTISLLSDSQIVRGEVLSSVYGMPSEIAHVIDVFDGTYNIVLESLGAEPPMLGKLTRNPRERLNACACGPVRPILYVASPITKEFSPQDTQIVESPNHTITLEHMLPYKYPLLGKLVLSKSHWRPIQLTIENPNTHRIHWKYELNHYRAYENGVYFPSEVKETALRESGRVIMENTMTLKEARFNEQADTSKLYPPVPRGARIIDFRFGDATPISYKVEDAIPSDAEARLELERKRFALRRQNPRSHRQTLFNGVACVLLGGAIMRRFGARRRKKTGE